MSEKGCNYLQNRPFRFNFCNGTGFAHQFQTKKAMIIKHRNTNLNRAFDEIFDAFPATWGSDSKPETAQPPVNIFETQDAFHIELIAPGKSKEEFKISIEKAILSVSTDQKKVEENTGKKLIRNEFVSRSFKRSFSIDEKINADAVEARYENGILYLVLPKKEEIKNTPKQIQVL